MGGVGALPGLWAQGGAATFEAGLPVVTQEGYARLSWSGLSPDSLAVGWRYEVQQDRQATFGQPRRLYLGTDVATFLSGLPNGTYYHRVRLVQPEAGQAGPWSASHRLEVRHHPLSLAAWLAGLGALVFVLTLVVVVHGAYRTRGEASSAAAAA